MKYYRDVDYFIYFEEFPHMGVPGMIAANSDGTANIFINTLYSKSKQVETIKHELRHLVRQHQYCDWLTIREIEAEADDDNPAYVFGEDFSYVEYQECRRETEASDTSTFKAENSDGDQQTAECYGKFICVLGPDWVMEK